MWLILSSFRDRSAHWAYQGLRSWGLDPVHFVATETLPNCSLWEHRVGSDGASVRITLPSGQTVSDVTLKGVLNRTVNTGQAHLNFATQHDRDYVASEQSAFYVSWLHSLRCPVINRADPGGLCGRWRDNSEWVALAAAAGLAVAPYRRTSDDALETSYGALFGSTPRTHSLIVLNGRVFGGCVPAPVEQACVRLGQRAGMDCLGIDLATVHSLPYVFAGATVLPELERGGEALLEHLMDTFEGGEL